MHCRLVCGDDLDETLKKCWEIENVNKEIKQSSESNIYEQHFERTQFRDERGRYVVTMPLRDHPRCLGFSREIALKRFELPVATVID